MFLLFTNLNCADTHSVYISAKRDLLLLIMLLVKCILTVEHVCMTAEHPLMEAVMFCLVRHKREGLPNLKKPC